MNLDDRVIIFSSPTPEATTATALLCRSLQRKGHLYHVRFVDVATTGASLTGLLSANSDATCFIVGTVLADSLSSDEIARCVLVGSDPPDHSDFRCIGDPSCVPASAYVLAHANLSTTTMDLQISALGSIIQERSTHSEASQELIGLAESKGLLKERKGLLLFGANFLPLNQVLNLCMSPYLHGFSGEPQACEDLLSKIDIPISKRTLPITQLNSKEMQKLVEELMRVDLGYKTSIIPLLVGRDTTFALETESSPLLFLSSAIHLLNTAWSRWELGMSTAILLGDRARMMSEIINTYKNHSYAVITALKQIYAGVSKQTEHDTSPIGSPISLQGVTKDVLPDVARVLFETGMVSTETPLLLNGDDGSVLAWHSNMPPLPVILASLSQHGILSRSASRNSIVLSQTFSSEDDLLSVITTTSEAD